MGHQISSVEASDIEQLIDRVGLPTVLRSIAEICGSKAEHVRMNWGDKPLAKLWERSARAIDHAANNSAMNELP